MEESGGGVKSDCFQRGDNVMGQKDVEEREQGVDLVERRMMAPGLETESGGTVQHGVEAGEISGSRRALYATHGVYVRAIRQLDCHRTQDFRAANQVGLFRFGEVSPRMA